MRSCKASSRGFVCFISWIQSVNSLRCLLSNSLVSPEMEQEQSELRLSFFFHCNSWTWARLTGCHPSGSPETQVTSCLRQTEHQPEKCADLRLGVSVDNRGAVYFPVRLCFVTLSTMSVSHSIIIWRQRRGRGGGASETASSFSCSEPRPVPPEAACLLTSGQETLQLTFNPLDQPKAMLSESSGHQTNPQMSQKQTNQSQT